MKIWTKVKWHFLRPRVYCCTKFREFV